MDNTNHDASSHFSQVLSNMDPNALLSQLLTAVNQGTSPLSQPGRQDQLLSNESFAKQMSHMHQRSSQLSHESSILDPSQDAEENQEQQATPWLKWKEVDNLARWVLRIPRYLGNASSDGDENSPADEDDDERRHHRKAFAMVTSCLDKLPSGDGGSSSTDSDTAPNEQKNASKGTVEPSSSSPQGRLRRGRKRGVLRSWNISKGTEEEREERLLHERLTKEMPSTVMLTATREDLELLPPDNQEDYSCNEPLFLSDNIELQLWYGDSPDTQHSCESPLHPAHKQPQKSTNPEQDSDQQCASRQSKSDIHRKDRERPAKQTSNQKRVAVNHELSLIHSDPEVQHSPCHPVRSADKVLQMHSQMKQKSNRPSSSYISAKFIPDSDQLMHSDDFDHSMQDVGSLTPSELLAQSTQHCDESNHFDDGGQSMQENENIVHSVDSSESEEDSDQLMHSDDVQDNENAVQSDNSSESMQGSEQLICHDNQSLDTASEQIRGEIESVNCQTSAQCQLLLPNRSIPRLQVCHDSSQPSLHNDKPLSSVSCNTGAAQVGDPAISVAVEECCVDDSTEGEAEGERMEVEVQSDVSQTDSFDMSDQSMYSAIQCSIDAEIQTRSGQCERISDSGSVSDEDIFSFRRNGSMCRIEASGLMEDTENDQGSIIDVTKGGEKDNQDAPQSVSCGATEIGDERTVLDLVNVTKPLGLPSNRNQKDERVNGKTDEDDIPIQELSENSHPSQTEPIDDATSPVNDVSSTRQKLRRSTKRKRTSYTKNNTDEVNVSLEKRSRLSSGDSSTSADILEVPRISATWPKVTLNCSREEASAIQADDDLTCSIGQCPSPKDTHPCRVASTQCKDPAHTSVPPDGIISLISSDEDENVRSPDRPVVISSSSENLGQSQWLSRFQDFIDSNAHRKDSSLLDNDSDVRILSQQPINVASGQPVMECSSKKSLKCAASSQENECIEQSQTSLVGSGQSNGSSGSAKLDVTPILFSSKESAKASSPDSIQHDASSYYQGQNKDTAEVPISDQEQHDHGRSEERPVQVLVSKEQHSKLNSKHISESQLTQSEGSTIDVEDGENLKEKTKNDFLADIRLMPTVGTSQSTPADGLSIGIASDELSSSSSQSDSDVNGSDSPHSESPTKQDLCRMDLREELITPSGNRKERTLGKLQDPEKTSSAIVECLDEEKDTANNLDDEMSEPLKQRSGHMPKIYMGSMQIKRRFYKKQLTSEPLGKLSKTMKIASTFKKNNGAGQALSNDRKCFRDEGKKGRKKKSASNVTSTSHRRQQTGTRTEEAATVQTREITMEEELISLNETSSCGSAGSSSQEALIDWCAEYLLHRE